MSFPVPPSNKPVTAAKPDHSDGKLSPNESEFILNDKLSKKHRSDPSVLAFIDSFIACKNIQQASEEAGISPKLGYQYRHRTDIAAAIQALIDRSVIKYGFDASEIVERTKEIVDGDIGDFFNADGTHKEIHELSPEARRRVKKWKAKNEYSTEKDMNGIERKIIVGRIFEVETYDKLKAVELVGREKDLFKNKSVVEHGVTKDMASFLLESAQRGEAAASQVKIPRTIEVDVTPSEEDESED